MFVKSRLFALSALLTFALAATAVAQQPPQPPPDGQQQCPPGQQCQPPSGGQQGQYYRIGLEVKVVDTANRTVEGVKHCLPPDQGPGQTEKFAVDSAVDMAKFNSDKTVGVDVDFSATPKKIMRVDDIPPCTFGGKNDAAGEFHPPEYTGPNGPGQGGPQGGSCPGGPGGPGGPQGPPQGGQQGPSGPPPPPAKSSQKEGEGEGGPKGGPQGNACGGPGGDPEFKGGFLNKVWKFTGEADGYDDGVLSMTISKILNLPKKFKDQDDDLLDEDARVLIAKSVRVYDKKNKKVGRDALGDAESVRVHGKLLKPSKWVKDEDDAEVPTIRAKKVYILD